MAKLTHLYSSVLLALSITCASVAQADDNQKLVQAVGNYQQAVQTGDIKSAVKNAKQAYELAEQLLTPENASFQTIADDYAYLLIKTKQFKQAQPILENLLTIKEKQYGRYAKELISPIKSLVAATKQQKSLNKEYSIRYQKLALRHFSDQYVEQFKDQPLESTQQALNLAAKVTDITGKNYQVVDGGKWDFIYNVDSDKDIAPLLAQMELSYRSAFGFLLAFNVASKPAEDKFQAVFFETRGDYIKYLDSFNDANRSNAARNTLGMYSPSENSLFLFARRAKNDDREEFLEVNTLRHEIAHQLFFNFGLHGRGVKYPRWVFEGIAENFEFEDIKNISGPHTDNVAFELVKGLKKLQAKNKLLSLKELIMLNQVSENARENVANVYATGAMLVRFLYEFYPDEFKNYIVDFSRRDSSTSAKRLAIFSRNVGKPDALQSEFDRFVSTIIETTIAKAKKQQAKVAKL